MESPPRRSSSTRRDPGARLHDRLPRSLELGDGGGVQAGTGIRAEEVCKRRSPQTGTSNESRICGSPGFRLISVVGSMSATTRALSRGRNAQAGHLPAAPIRRDFNEARARRQCRPFRSDTTPGISGPLRRQPACGPGPATTSGLDPRRSLQAGSGRHRASVLVSGPT